ncbi:hypothetical protein [Hyphomicrobium sp. DY-1]|uniref:hypothetical protein n=1 Tax=Hyphomicrobium sp. DY-1 TaxID=3075650 RepID=UPI0039C3D7B9
MKVTPTLFSAPMVRAILDGRKTMTRRILKPQPDFPPHPRGGIGFSALTPERHYEIRGWTEEQGPLMRHRPLRFWRGDLLWVRETWARVHDNFDCDDPFCRHRFMFAADDQGGNDELKWKPSIHMPRLASRLTLEVKSVKVERIQDISDDDALAEGVSKIKDHCYVIKGFGYDTAGLCHSRPTIPFAILWKHLNGEEAWEANPYVVAVTFKTHQCNVDDFLKQREAA